jgi:hypothetical protein
LGCLAGPQNPFENIVHTHLHHELNPFAVWLNHYICSVHFIAKDSHIPRVPDFPHDGKGHRRPKVDVDAGKRRCVPNVVDGGGGLEAQLVPYYRGKAATEEEVVHVFRECTAPLARLVGDVCLWQRLLLVSTRPMKSS